MAAIPITVQRRIWTPSSGGRLWVIVIPRGQVLTIERFEGDGMHTAAVTPTRVGIYKVDASRNGSGGTPATTDIITTIHDLAQPSVTPASALPAGISGSWGVNQGDYTTPPTINAADLMHVVSVQPYGGNNCWPPDGRPIAFHNLQAGDMQLAFVGMSDTGTQANGVEWRLHALAGV